MEILELESTMTKIKSPWGLNSTFNQKENELVKQKAINRSKKIMQSKEQREKRMIKNLKNYRCKISLNASTYNIVGILGEKRGRKNT